MQFFTTLATLVAAASAIMVNSPAMNAVWTTGEDQSVSWTSVNTDATNVSVYLVNFSKYPTISTLIQANVPVSSNGITVPGDSIDVTGQGFQINLIAPTNPSQILAQSNQFSIVAGEDEDSSNTAAAAPATTVATSTTRAAATTAPVATVPVTNNGTGNATTGSQLPTTNGSTSAGSVAKLSVAGLLFAGALCLF